jgi:exo-1,4-beta-D-glucosaminidase
MAGDSAHYELRVVNTGKAVAFFVHLRALKGKDGGDILPLIVSDNYILLAPGETRSIRCSYRDKDAGGGMPYFLLSAWNLDPSGSRSDGDTGFEEGLQR